MKNTAELKCICKGNWSSIISEVEPLIGNLFNNDKGKPVQFIGVLHGDDDYYYTFINVGTSKIEMLSCVVSMEMAGYTPLITVDVDIEDL